MESRKNFSELSNKVIGCAIEVHKALGPGLLESAYQQCLCHELKLNGVGFQVEKPIFVTMLFFVLCTNKSINLNVNICFICLA